MVSSAMPFMADESLFVSRATSCCIRLYSYQGLSINSRACFEVGASLPPESRHSCDLAFDRGVEAQLAL